MEIAADVAKKSNKLVAFFKNLIQNSFRLPETDFKHSLYFELIKEGASKHGASEVKLPKVEFKEGPLDLTLGNFNFNTKTIVVDSLEIYLLSIFSSPASQHELEKIYDQKLTDTLAHETGHWILDAVKGKDAVKEIKWMYLKYFLLFILPFFFISWGLIELFYGFAASLFGLGFLSGLILGVPLVACGLLLVILTAIVNLVIAGILAKIITYKKCEHERFARAYADEVKNDPRWKSVIVCRR